jgi:hypothetical protein
MVCLELSCAKKALVKGNKARWLCGSCFIREVNGSSVHSFDKYRLEIDHFVLR